MTADPTVSKKLNAGDMFPQLVLREPSGASFELPGGMKTDFGIVPFYRGHW